MYITENSKPKTKNSTAWDGPPVAVLWTQSLVWGLLCIDTLTMLEVPFRLLSASEICRGCLDAFRILIVPGGWAAHKVRTLGQTGRLKIAGFIERGGSYLGFCGGAGLALSSPPALYLTPIRRMPLSERLPNASGQIYVSGDPTHPAWKNMPARIPVSVWWPSQFQLDPTSVRPACLASYSVPGEGFQVADLRVGEVNESGGWEELEKAYGINLNPARIMGHPAIIETGKKKGRLVLSYAHLETPGDVWGNLLFSNILNYLNEVSKTDDACPGRGIKSAPGADPKPRLALKADSTFCSPPTHPRPDHDRSRQFAPDSIHHTSGISKAKEAAADLIAFGEANLLWAWRKPWLLNWRRGIRGLEYGTLYVTLCQMAKIEQDLASESAAGRLPSMCCPNWPEMIKELDERTLEFCALAKQLLLEEKISIGTGTVSKLGKVSEKVDSLRHSLFGSTMNYGGLCGALFDLIDHMLLELMRKTPG